MSTPVQRKRENAIARQAILNHSSLEKDEGRIKCPICSDGVLCYAITEKRNKVAGACSTMFCVAWMD